MRCPYCGVDHDKVVDSRPSDEGAAVRLPDDSLMATATQTLVLVNLPSRRPTPVPEELRAAIRAFEGADLEG